MGCQADAKLVDFRESAIADKSFLDADKSFLDGHVSSMDGIAADAKRKWMEFSMQAENDAKDGVDYSAVKHCCMEVLLQQCASTADSALKHWKRTQDSVNHMENKTCFSYGVAYHVAVIRWHKKTLFISFHLVMSCFCLNFVWAAEFVYFPKTKKEN